MLNTMLANLYERDLRRLIDEVNLYKNETDLWKTQGTVKNSGGNLALHIVGGLNHFIGATLARTGYVRNRDQEFTNKDVDRKEIVVQLEALIPMIHQTLLALTPGELEADFPVFFDKPNTSTGYVLLQLSLHLNYHLGQVNYLRRALE